MDLENMEINQNGELYYRFCCECYNNITKQWHDSIEIINGFTCNYCHNKNTAFFKKFKHFMFKPKKCHDCRKIIKSRGKLHAKKLKKFSCKSCSENNDTELSKYINF